MGNQCKISKIKLKIKIKIVKRQCQQKQKQRQGKRKIKQKQQCCIEQHKQGINQMFLIRNMNYLYPQKRFIFYGQFLVRAEKVLKLLYSVDDKLQKKILDRTKNYYNKAIQQCFQLNPTQIIPFYCIKPMQARQRLILNQYFQTKGHLVLADIKKILSVCFINRNYSTEYQLEYLIQKIIGIINRKKYDQLQLMEIINQIFKDINKDQNRKIFLEFAMKVLNIVTFKQYSLMPDQSLLRASKFVNQLKPNILQKLCLLFKKNFSKIERDGLVSRLINQNLSDQDQQFIIVNLYAGQHVPLQTQQKQLWQAMKKTPKLLKAYQKIYTKTFKQLIKNIFEKIQSKDLYQEQFEQIHKNHQQIDLMVKSLCKFKQTIVHLKQQKNDYQYRLENINQILKIHQQFSNFQVQIKQIQNLKDLIHNQVLKNSLKIPNKYQQIYEVSRQVLTLTNLEIWQKKVVTSLQKILENRKQTIKIIKLAIDQFNQKVISFNKFYKFFPKEYLQQILKYNSNQQSKKSIKQANFKTDLKWLQQFQRYCRSLDYIYTTVQNKICDFKQFYKLINSLNQKQWQINLNQMIKIIDQANNNFIKINVTVCSSRDQIGRIILRSGECKQMFKYIESQNLDQKNINDLKQYINDLENSILRLQTVKQFQNVVLFWSIVKQSKAVSQLISKLNKELEIKNWILSENIHNSYVNLKLIQQKIDQSVNRQTSFKYQIQKIFQYSIFKMQRSNDSIDIKITIKSNQEQLAQQQRRKQKAQHNLQVSKASRLDNNTIDLKRIMNYKQKTLLLISDFERQKANIDQKTQSIIDILKQFYVLYKVIDQIVKGSQILVKYGYDPQSLKFQTIIKNKNYQTVKERAQFLTQQSTVWMKQIKKIYQQSYILTHFLGPQLNHFVQLTLKKQYHPSLEWIIGITQNQFQQLFNTITVRGILKKFKSQHPLDKVKLIDKIYQKWKRIEPRHNIQKYKDQPTITLITCRQQQFYCCLFDVNEKPQINQILYCQSETRAQELQVFLNRTRLRPYKKHFVVAVHNLNTQLQLYFCDLLNLYFINGVQNFGAKLCFIDYSSNQKVYLHICRPNLFNVQKITMNQVEIKRRAKAIAQLSGDTYIIQSVRPGLGKTFLANKLSQNRNLKYFPLAGNISFTVLVNRLKSIQLASNQSLLIQIGHIENKKKLQVFLYQLIMFRCFHYRGFMYLPKSVQIIVQIQNIFDIEQQKQFHIIKFLKQHSSKYKFIKQFSIEQIQFNQNSKQEKFTLNYLDLTRNGIIGKRQLRIKQFLKTPSNAKQLIKMYFVDKFIEHGSQPSYALYRKFMDILFVTFKTFSQAGYFAPNVIKQSHIAFPNLQLDQVRVKFLNICIDNSLQFLKQTITTNQFDGNSNKQDFRQKLNKFPLLILPSNDFNSYQFVYLQQDQLPLSIKSLLLSQDYKVHRALSSIRDKRKINDLFKEKALNNMKQQKLQMQFYSILHVLSGNKKLLGSTVANIKQNLPNLKKYSLTLDNFFKICLIIQRSICRIPIVIMGQSGVGKTALIRFLVETIMEEQLICFNVHAGINQQQIVNWAHQIIQKAQNLQHQQKQYKLQRLKSIEQDMKVRKQRGQKVSNQGPTIDNLTKKIKKLWVFFDQFNTTDQLSMIKEMVIDRRFRGKLLPENVVMIAACNPYRKKQAKNVIKAGIKKQSVVDDNLAFKVKPPLLSMIQFMWDYQQLRQNQISMYISKILQQLQFQMHDKLVQAISWTHQFFKANVQLSSVSLRDVSRFKQLYYWFLKFMPQKPVKNPLQQIKRSKAQAQINYKMNRNLRSIILSISFCYSLRFATNIERNRYLDIVQGIFGFQRDYMKRVMKNQQIDYVNRLKSPGAKIALNFALRQNVFTTLVCLMNKIPVLIIGNPGSSKSLSIKMIASNFRGINSASQFCKSFPQINMIYFQGSQSCTSKGIEAVFEKAIRSKQQFDSKRKQNHFKLENCILFDQIGLAQKSVHNPLKVLHSKLQTNRKQIGFIGISNWQLDAAKMSRFLILARSSPDLTQLQQTSVQIYQSYFNNASESTVQYFQKLATYYSKFQQAWNSDKNHRQGFFGLRDFYCYVKYVCQVISNQGHQYQILQHALAKSIQINFDGQPGSLKLFNQIAQISSNIKQLNPIQIVQQNLNNKQSRCLLLIVKGDALIPIINESIHKANKDRRVVCIYGSTFKNDQQSQQYNLEMTSIIISHISRGNILTFKDINNSIQTSLYDLFNKSFYQVGEKKYCRIAVGANSNPKCFVHQNFNAIVYVDQSKILQTDLAFLNRFQKHYLNLKSMISIEEEDIVYQIMKWIDDVLSFRHHDSAMKQQNYLINSCVQSIVTLIIKYRDSQSLIKIIKKKLLQNRTFDFEIALRQNMVSEDRKNEIEDLIRDQPNFKNTESDMIIFTYDQYLDMSQTHVLWNQHTQKIRISQMKCQRDLRKQIQKFFEYSSKDTLHIHINFQNQSQHVNLVLHIASSLKLQYQSKKKLIIIVQLHRFSLINLGIQHINISYLHNFQQYFSEDLTLQNDTQSLLKIQNCQKLYHTLKMQQDFNQLILETLKRFKFTIIHHSNQNAIQTANERQLIESYFLECTKITQVQLFKQNCKLFIMRHLKKQYINYQILLDNRQNMLQCSSVKQAIIKYMEQKVIELLCHFYYRIISNNFVFNFIPNNCIEYFKQFNHMDSVTILEQFLQKSQKIYWEMFKKFLDQYVVRQDKDQMKKFTRGIQTNIVEISFPTLFPLTWKQFPHIFKGTDKTIQSVQSYSSKLLEYSLSEQKKDDSLFEMNYNKSISIFQQKTKFNTPQYSYWSMINQNVNQLSVGYLFDVLQYLCLETQTSNTYICKILDLILWVFEGVSLQKKIIMLTMDRNFWACVFEILIICFKFEDHIIVQQFIQKAFTQDQQIQILQKKSSQNQINEINLSKQIVKFGSKVLLLVDNFLQLKIENVKHYGISRYLDFFKQITIPVRKILTSYQEYGLGINQQFLVTMKLIQVLEKMDKKNISHLIQQFVLSSSQGCYPKKIYYYIKQLIYAQQHGYNNPTKIQILLNYLSFNIFCSWYQISLQNNQQQQCIQCFNHFITFSNKYPYFANNSVFFFEIVFEKFTQSKGLQNKIKSLQQISQLFGNIFNSKITFQNNFSVSLANFFSNQVKTDINEIIQKQQKQITQNCNIVTQFWQQFRRQINSQSQDNIQQLLKIQFCKIYTLEYLQSLVNQKNTHMLSRIDNQLSLNNILAKHLRIYMMKNLYAKTNDLNIVKKQYLQKNRCQWIKLCADLIQQSQVQQCLVPPPIGKSSKVCQIIKKFRYQKYIPTNLFHDIIQQAHQSPEQMYQFLNFILIDFYTRTVPRNLIQFYKRQFENRDDMKKQQFRVQRTIILRYFNHQITHTIRFNQNTTIDQFMDKQLSILNILNMIVALKKIDNPFMEMFFQKSGRIPQKIQRWLEARFLIGGKQNANVSLLQLLIERNDNTPGYYKCSTTCDYYYSVGGGRLGCQNVVHQSQCPFCGGIIGGRTHGVLDRQNQGARKVTLQELVPACNQIRENHIMLVKGVEYKLIGYTCGNNLQQLKQADIDNNRVNLITKRMLNYIVFAIWYLFTQFGFYNKDQMNRLLKLRGDQGLAFLRLALGYYETKVSESVQVKNKSQNIIWQLGIQKYLFESFKKYKNSMKQNQRGNLSLTSCWHRDKFQKTLSNQLIRFTGGRQKQQLILKNRTLRQGFTLTKQDFVKELGDFRIHLIQYPRMRIFKMIQIQKSPNYRNLIKQYAPVLPNQHPVLNYLINNQDTITKMSHFKIIYMFISKILKAAHFKITRQYAKQNSLVGFIHQFFQGDKNMKQQMVSFCQSWNQIAKTKYQLRYRCHDDLGQLPMVSPDDPLRIFLPDNKHSDNRDGQKLLALLQVSAAQYNALCRGLQDSISKLKAHDDLSIFSLSVLNPTQVTAISKMIKFPLTQIQEYVRSYSCFSVQYGISVPHYALDEIQSLAIKYFHGCKYILQDNQQYNSINFVGELRHCITDIRTTHQQVPLSQTNSKQAVHQFISRLFTRNRDIFFKIMKNIQGSLQNIMIYYKNTKPKKLSIRQFISQNKIQGLSQQLFQDPFQSLPLSTIVDLYQNVQMSTFDQVLNLLDPGYNSQELTSSQKQNIQKLIKKMELKDSDTVPQYNDFRIALYRFASRSLLLMQRDPNLILYDFIAYSDELWPNSVQYENFIDQGYKQSLTVPLKKVGKIMQIVPPPKLKEDFSKKQLVNHEDQLKQMEQLKIRKRQTIQFSKKSNVLTINLAKRTKKHI